MLAKLINRLIQPFGARIISAREKDVPQDFDPVHREIWNNVKKATMTSPERVHSLIESVKYVVENEIEGSIVECGVWKGGSSMAAAFTLIEMEDVERKLYLYDTFEGMTRPEEVDRKAGSGEGASAKFGDLQMGEDSSNWCYSPIDEVTGNITSTGYPEEKISLIKGKVEETLMSQLPEGRIAILRLDTDWYQSTKVELEVLYPLLSEGGVLIIDDYGAWEGARRAVDEYFDQDGVQRPLLHRIDSTGRIGIKTT